MLGYFGPAGTFTHQALLTISSDEARPFATVAAALDAVRAGEVEAVVVPIENSMEGGVSATLDNLASGDRLMIVREVLLPVQFGLFVRPGTSIDQIRSIVTHPHAYNQTRDWIAARVPEAQVMTEGGSTAAGALEVSNPDSRHDAAICAMVAGQMYGLEAVASGIADNEAAVTRFVLVSKQGAPSAPTGADKTTLVAYMHEDHPGSLQEILDQFTGRGVNLSRIESRPTKTTLGQYCFSIDAEGHVLDARMGEALTGLHRVCKKVVFLGSYARADRVKTRVPASATDEAYEKAAAWLQQLRSTGRDA
ncbi:prephenate dehydratase [Luteococcus sp. OSA5]|uniref:prephenate dehydratase n=1 Tax=Luteococcus sp. OSA5 TaxID=3401630 RepID=UPI003B43C54D